MTDEPTLPPVKETKLHRLWVWVDSHRDISIPVVTYLAGMATVIVLRWIF